MSTRKRRAVFFDRDGTLNEEVGYLADLAQFRLYPFAGEAVRQINAAGLLAIVVTNQSGVGRGFVSEELVQQANVALLRGIEEAGGRLDAIYYCPHYFESEIERYRLDCTCRKPLPGMLEEAADRFGIALDESFVIGDRYLDVQMAHAVGAASVLVLTGFGHQEWQDQSGQAAHQPRHVAENVSAAAQWVLQQLHKA